MMEETFSPLAHPGITYRSFLGDPGPPQNYFYQFFGIWDVCLHNTALLEWCYMVFFQSPRKSDPPFGYPGPDVFIMLSMKIVMLGYTPFSDIQDLLKTHHSLSKSLSCHCWIPSFQGSIHMYHWLNPQIFMLKPQFIGEIPKRFRLKLSKFTSLVKSPNLHEKIPIR